MTEKRKGPSAEYQKARRDAIKAGTWQIKSRGARKGGGNTPVAIEPQSCVVAPSTQAVALPRLDLDGYPIGG